MVITDNFWHDHSVHSNFLAGHYILFWCWLQHIFLSCSPYVIICNFVLWHFCTWSWLSFATLIILFNTKWLLIHIFLSNIHLCRHSRWVSWLLFWPCSQNGWRTWLLQCIRGNHSCAKQQHKIVNYIARHIYVIECNTLNCFNFCFNLN